MFKGTYKIRSGPNSGYAVVVYPFSFIIPATLRREEIYIGFVSTVTGIYFWVWNKEGNSLNGYKEWDLMEQINEKDHAR